MYLSIVIPAYNEEKRLKHALEQIRSYMENKRMDYEVIVVDDGSTDRTSEVAEKSLLFKMGRLKVLRNRENTGKGYSVKRGVEEASGDNILFSDSDLSTPITELDKLMRIIDKGADIAIGSRSIRDSKVVIRQPFYRQTMGKMFNLIVRIMLGERLKDTQCGFKLFKKEAARSIFKEVTVKGFAFDAEVLFLARKHGFRTEEIGVVWKNSQESTVHPVSSSLSMLKDIIKIRYIHR